MTEEDYTPFMRFDICLYNRCGQEIPRYQHGEEEPVVLTVCHECRTQIWERSGEFRR